MPELLPPVSPPPLPGPGVPHLPDRGCRDSGLPGQGHPPRLQRLCRLPAAEGPGRRTDPLPHSMRRPSCRQGRDQDQRTDRRLLSPWARLCRFFQRRRTDRRLPAEKRTSRRPPRAERLLQRAWSRLRRRFWARPAEWRGRKLFWPAPGWPAGHPGPACPDQSRRYPVHPPRHCRCHRWMCQRTSTDCQDRPCRADRGFRCGPPCDPPGSDPGRARACPEYPARPGPLLLRKGRQAWRQDPR